MNKFKQTFTRCVKSEGFSGAALTAVLIAAVVLVNVIIYTLASYFGWYFTSVAEDDLSISDVGDSLFAEAMAEGLTVEVIFCMYEKELEKHDTGSFVLRTAKQFEEKYPDFIDLTYINIITKLDSEGKPIENIEVYENAAGEDAVMNKTSVIFRCGSNFRVLTDSYTGAGFADFFTLDSSATVSSYNGEEVFAAMVGWVLHKDHGKAYVTVGHGETASVTLYNALVCAGYFVEEYNLREGEVPEDGELIVISNPKNDFERAAEGSKKKRSEIERLQSFAERGGSFLVFLDPEAAKLHNLESFILGYGISMTENEEGERLTVKDTENAISPDGFTIVAEYSSSQYAALMQEKTAGVDGRVILKRVAPLTLFGNAQAVLTSSSASVAEAGGETVDRGGVYPISAVSAITHDNGNTSELFLAPTVYFTATDAMITEGYSNKDFLYSLFDVCFEKGDMPYGCNAVIFNDGILENLTMGTARWYTVLLLSFPAIVAIACVAVMIRRKNR